MEIREMRAFVTVVDTGGITAAARVLHVSQSALSQTVRTLEKQVGGQLLVRDHSGARPTDLGKVLLDEARSLVERHDRLVSTLRGPAAEPGHLRVGVPLEIPTDLLPQAIAEVSAAHPDVVVSLRHARSTAQLDAMRAGEIDVALVRDRPADHTFDSVLAVEEAMGTVLPRALADRLAEPTGVRLHRLSDLAWVAFARSDAPAWYDQVAATLRSHGVTGVDAAGADDRPVPREVKFAAVGTGHAFALASPAWVHPLPEGLVWHPLIGNPIVRRTWAVWQADSRRRELATLVGALDITMR